MDPLVPQHRTAMFEGVDVAPLVAASGRGGDLYDEESKRRSIRVKGGSPDMRGGAGRIVQCTGRRSGVASIFSVTVDGFTPGREILAPRRGTT